MPAYFKTSIREFNEQEDNLILGFLTSAGEKEGFTQQSHAQTDAWEKEIILLKECFPNIVAKYDHSLNWSLLLEYPIPRRNKRIDAVILAEDVILVLEFKAKEFSINSQLQVEDYALDLRDFHEESRNRIIIPILVSTTAIKKTNFNRTGKDSDLVRSIIVTNPTQLPDKIIEVYKSNHDPKKPPINSEQWDHSPYKPVPTIIEAAELLFAGHSVRDIAYSFAGVHNLGITSDFLIKTIQSAAQDRKKIICFVTGVPGSGKTLAGLNVVHSPEIKRDNKPAGVFLSGNRPLVKIVTEALVRDKINTECQGKITKKEVKRIVSTFIQSLYSFISEYIDKERDKPPYDHVLVFDEAQRAWNLDKEKRKYKRDMSEPHMIFNIMDRLDWAVIIALVGGGQEIHDGEAGLAEWGRNLTQKFPHWEVRVAPEVLIGGPSLAGSLLFEGLIPKNITIIKEDALHLPVSIRDYKAKTVASWVNEVLRGHNRNASDLMSSLKDFPITLTRDLTNAKNWLKNQTRGLRKCGLVASSGAKRLRAYGIEVSSGFTSSYSYEDWFLNPQEDVRSSSQLEVVATEFECQGLELDWIGICWGNDLIWDPQKKEWIYRNLKGSRWQQVNNKITQNYLLNKYRVLLTRAREGFIIWVPKGDKNDSTLAPGDFENIAKYLLSCGVQNID